MTLNTTGTQSITATDVATPAISGTQSGITVLEGSSAVALEVTGLPTSQTAGTAGSVTVTAKTYNGRTVNTYSGTVHFTSSDGQALLPTNYTFVPTDNGTHVFTAGVTLKTAGTHAVTATDIATSITRTQSGIAVTAATAASLTVAGFPNPQSAGAPGGVTVTAKDAYHNTATTYAGTVQFSSSDGAAVLPASYSFVAGDNGTHAFPNGVTFNTVGTQSVTATDTVSGAVTGTQSGIVINQAPSSFTWTSTGSGTWSNSANWSNNLGLVAAPVAGGRSNYSFAFTNTGAYTTTQDLGDALQLNQLSFTGLSWQTFSGGSLSLVNNGATSPQITNTNAAVNFAIPLVLAANTTFAGNGGELGVSGAVSGVGSLTKSGTHQLDLNGTNTYQGGTIVTGGNI